MKIKLLLMFTVLSAQTVTYSQNTTYNRTDEKGYKQGFWINFKMDTLIIMWQAIISNTSGIDTTICKSVYYEGFYKNNKKDSVWKVYNTQKNKVDGKKINFGSLIYQAQFKNDQLNGLLITYFPSGKIKSEIEFYNGNANGKINCYFGNGKLKYTGNMVFGEEFINGSEYSESGYKLKDRKFNYNQLLKEWTNLDDFFHRIN